MVSGRARIGGQLQVRWFPAYTEASSVSQEAGKKLEMIRKAWIDFQERICVNKEMQS